MADNSTFITGVAEGALASAFDGLPPWATQNTSEKIQKLLEKQLNLSGKLLSAIGKASPKSGNSSSRNPTDSKSLDTLLGKYLGEANKSNRKKKKDDDDLANKSMLSGKKLTSTAQKLDYVLTGLATVGKKVLDAEGQYLKTYDALYQSGINVLDGNTKTADGFSALNQMVNATGMRLDTMQKAIEQYSTSINALGFTKFTKSLGIALPGLTELGFNSKDAANLMGAYVDSQKGYTDIRNKSESELAADAVNFGDKLTKMSLAVGMSRDQFLENIKANSKSVDSTLVSATYGVEAAKKVNDFVSGFSDKNTQNMFSALAASQTPQLTDSYQNLTKAGFGDIANKLTDIAVRSRTEDSVSLRKEMADMQPEIMRRMGNGGLGSLIGIKSEGASEAAQALTGLTQEIRITSSATTAQTDAAIKAAAATANLQTQQEKFLAIPEAAFSPTVNQIEMLGNTLKRLNGVMYDSIDAIGAPKLSLVGATLIVAGFGAALAVTIAQLRTFGTLLSSGAGLPGGGLGGAGGKPSSAGGAVGKLAGVGRMAATAAAMGYVMDGVAGAAGVGKNNINEEQDKNNWARMNTWQKAQSGAARSLEGIADLLFLNNVANEATATRIKNETEYLNSANNIKLPDSSKVQTSPEDSKKQEIKPADATAAVVAVAAAKSALPDKDDINSQLMIQTKLLDQLLQSHQDQLSVNKDILKYTRVQT